MRPRAAVSMAFLLALSCKPDLGERDSLVAEERILAVRTDPAEVEPGAMITASLLVASPEGTMQTPKAYWAFCATPKLTTENNAVSAECLEDGVRVIGGPSIIIAAPIPGDACSLFGPEIPPGGFRPRDADSTGGYYQPLRVTVDGLVGFGLARIECNLANAPVDAALQFQRQYVANKNPRIGSLTAAVDGAERALDRLPAGRKIQIRVTWDAGDAESYVAFDPSTQSVVSRRESMRVSWFVTAGELDADRTGLGEADHDSFTDNGWTSSGSGVVHLWIVLRDSRGGVDFAGYDLVVSP
jgi:hypothetical protein